ncbi:MAG: S-layer homology domain-containing protein [Lachnospiraceae bacterium]|nr:S-layer homology domain-containing protein [Lachnospiraceae bacterium]
MKKRIIIGLLAAVMALQVPTAVLAGEAADSTSRLTIPLSIVEGEEAVDNMLFDEGISPLRKNNKGTAEIKGLQTGFEQAEELQAFKSALDYCLVWPYDEMANKKLWKGDSSRLAFNLYSRGNSTDQFIIRLYKGGNTSGEFMDDFSSFMPASEGFYVQNIRLNTPYFDAGTYTIEYWAMTHINGAYVETPDSRGNFQFQVVNDRIPLMGVALSETGKQMRIEQEIEVDLSLTPSDTTDDTMVTWTSSNENVAKAYEDYSTTHTGLIRAVGYGTADITATVAGHTATFTVAVSPKTDLDFPFTDIMIDDANWKYTNVKYVHSNGIMNGISSTTWFKPDAPLTRAMFATVLYRMAGSPATNYSARFSDVPAGQYYSQPIIWANDKQIVNGLGDGSYGVDRNITREQIARMLYEYARSSGKNVSQAQALNSFTDTAKVSPWATGYLQWATAVGLISGKPNGDGTYRLDPQGEATRAECAKMLTIFDQKY